MVFYFKTKLLYPSFHFFITTDWTLHKINLGMMLLLQFHMMVPIATRHTQAHSLLMSRASWTIKRRKLRAPPTCQILPLFKVLLAQIFRKMNLPSSRLHHYNTSHQILSKLQSVFLPSCHLQIPSLTISHNQLQEVLEQSLPPL